MFTLVFGLTFYFIFLDCVGSLLVAREYLESRRWLDKDTKFQTNDEENELGIPIVHMLPPSLQNHLQQILLYIRIRSYYNYFDTMYFHKTPLQMNAEEAYQWTKHDLQNVEKSIIFTATALTIPSK